MASNMGNAAGLITGRSQDLEFIISGAKAAGVLTVDEEEELFERIKNGDQAARSKVIACNQLFVYSIAKSYTADPDLLPDLISEGVLGLIAAVDKFDPTMGFKFITYAVQYVKRYIHDYIYIKRPAVFRHNHITVAVGKVSKFREKFLGTFGRLPSDPEVEDYMDAEGIAVPDGSCYGTPKYVSSDEPASDDDEGRGPSDIIGAMMSQRSNTEEDMDRADSRMMASGLLAMLTDRERDIIATSYGISRDMPESDETIAMRYGVTVVRVRQIKEGALKKMRASM